MIPVKFNSRISLFFLLWLSFLLSPTLYAAELQAGEPHVYGPVKMGESIRNIAETVRGEHDIRIRDIVEDIYYDNPEAFISKSSKTLRPGSLLSLPHYLAWNMPIAANHNELPEHATATASTDSSATIDSANALAADTTISPALSQPEISKPQSTDASPVSTQLKMTQRELDKVRKDLQEARDEHETYRQIMTAFLLLIAVIIISILLALLSKRKPQRESAAQKPADPLPYTPATKPEDVSDLEFEEASGTTQLESDTADDITPLNPLTSLDADQTPVAATPTLHISDDYTWSELSDDISEKLSSLSGDFHSISGDKPASNLTLARVYLDLGDYSHARKLLDQVMLSGTPEYQQQAELMLDEINKGEQFASSFNDIIDKLPEPEPSATSPGTQEIREDSSSFSTNRLMELSSRFSSLSENKNATRLALATAHINLEEYEEAWQILDEIVASGDPDFIQQAQDLLEDIRSFAR